MRFSLQDFNQHIYIMFQVHVQIPNFLMTMRLRLYLSLPGGKILLKDDL